ncbi:unnamed protein product, partial [marine sediment metagenome]
MVGLTSLTSINAAGGRLFRTVQFLCQHLPPARDEQRKILAR